MKNTQKGVLKRGGTIIIILMIMLFLINSQLTYDKRILKGYYRKEDYSEAHCYRDYVDYYKYYYAEDQDVHFQNSKIYYKVGQENIEKLKCYFNDFKEWMEAGNRLADYDFDLSVIDEEDYFTLSTDTVEDSKGPEKLHNYSVFLYDKDSHILYAILFKNG